MEERRLTCIGCPMGCPLVVTMDGGEVVSVTGNTCKRGEIYGRKEVTNQIGRASCRERVFAKV